jgi:hypothetical protein
MDYYEQGYRAGFGSGSWVVDGNTKDETRAAILRGYDEGDPEVMDLQPNPLSGEWAGESIPELFGEWPEDDDLSAFEDGFSQGFWDAVLAACQPSEVDA